MLSDQERIDIRAAHRRQVHYEHHPPLVAEGRCGACYKFMPCTTLRLLDALEASEAEVRRLRKLERAVIEERAASAKEQELSNRYGARWIDSPQIASVLDAAAGRRINAEVALMHALEQAGRGKQTLMGKWVYEVEVVGCHNMRERLLKLTAEGWELITVTQYGDYYTVFLRRQCVLEQAGEGRS